MGYIVVVIKNSSNYKNTRSFDLNKKKIDDKQVISKINSLIFTYKSFHFRRFVLASSKITLEQDNVKIWRIEKISPAQNRFLWLVLNVGFHQLMPTESNKANNLNIQIIDYVVWNSFRFHKSFWYSMILPQKMRLKNSTEFVKVLKPKPSGKLRQ